jgi:hypothetical protein
MKHLASVVIIGLGVGYAALPAFAAVDTVGKPSEVTATEHFDLAPGGIVHIDSYGILNIEGWDKPEVEITYTKSRPLRFGGSPSPDDDKARLDSIHVKTERKSPGELTITTTLKSRHGDWAPPLPAYTTNDVNADYEIHVPRDARLDIRHGSGLVQVRWVTGDIEAKAKRGDILLWLPLGAYSIDATTKFGIVSSELEGEAHNSDLIGEHFVRSSPAPAHQLKLHMGFGGITIRQIPPETESPMAASPR